MPEIIDSFEDGDISEYSGATADFSAGTDHPYDGSYNLSAGNSSVHLWRTDVTIERGETPFGAWVRPEIYENFFGDTQATNTAITWAVQSDAGSGWSDGSYYYAIVRPGQNDFEIGCYDAGSNVLYDSASQTISSGTYYNLEVESWDYHGNLTVELKDTSGSVLNSLSTTDSTFDSGGIGWADQGFGNRGGDYDYYYKPAQLSAPSNLHFNDTTTEDQLTLDWDTIGTGASGYYVYRAQSSGASKSDYTQVANVTGPPYTDTALEDGERYYYRVSSYN